MQLGVERVWLQVSLCRALCFSDCAQSAHYLQLNPEITHLAHEDVAGVAVGVVQADVQNPQAVHVAHHELRGGCRACQILPLPVFPFELTIKPNHPLLGAGGGRVRLYSEPVS
jgi:hypothetical protein